ncbi:MAG TPA: hypothetical protein VF743_12415, partial [Acidimicrobiales bacterium]
PVAEAGRAAREVVVVLAGELVEAGTAGAPRRLGPGTWVGHTEVVAGRPHDRTLLAGAGVEVLVVNGPSFRWAVQTLPGLLADVQAASAAAPATGAEPLGAPPDGPVGAPVPVGAPASAPATACG